MSVGAIIRIIGTLVIEGIAAANSAVKRPKAVWKSKTKDFAEKGKANNGIK